MDIFCTGTCIPHSQIFTDIILGSSLLFGNIKNPKFLNRKYFLSLLFDLKIKNLVSPSKLTAEYTFRYIFPLPNSYPVSYKSFRFTRNQICKHPGYEAGLLPPLVCCCADVAASNDASRGIGSIITMAQYTSLYDAANDNEFGVHKRHRHRHKHRQRQSNMERQSNIDTHTHTQPNRQTHTQRDTHTQTHRQTQRLTLQAQ